MPLNPSQTQAVTTCDGFQLILAGPGSGKTRVITEKILHLLDKGIPANQILALTFSYKAASEMSDRIEAQRPHLDLAVHTFPTFCLDILKENVPASGMSVCGGIFSRTTQLVRGLRNTGAFGSGHIQVGNNSAEIVRAVIDGNEVNRPFWVNINNPPGIPIWYQEPEYGSLQKDHNKTR